MQSSSKGRAIVISIILIVALVTSLGLGIGLGWKRWSKTDDKDDVTTTPVSADALKVTPSTSKERTYKFAAVAADAAECSEIGKRIMAVDGGSAVDAAIAGILCVGLYNMHSCGIGGGHFSTYYNRSTGIARSIIAREQAPSGASRDMYKVNGTSSQSGGLSIGIPGEIRGLWELHKLGGRLPWRHLFQPSIRLCREGIRVGDALVEGVTDKEKFYEEFPSFRDFIHNNSTGELYKAGDIIKLPKLAYTLEQIADHGPDAFYNGNLSASIVQDIQDAGGIITESDLANYTALAVETVVSTLKDNMTVYSPPPPSSGAVYQFILNILNGYDMGPDSISTVDMATVTWHRIVEAFKHAYSLRTQLGDNTVGTQAFVDYVDRLVQNMTDREFGELKRAMINDTRTFNTAHYQPSFSIEWDHGTAHLSVLGSNGDAVSMTSTINLHFGSKVIGSRTGIIFNDEMDDFSTPGTKNYFGVPASPANFIEPWKRPLSSMCPSIVVDKNGDVLLVVGASGGTKITTASALVTIESLWFNWDIKQSIDYPRLHHQLFPTTIKAQAGYLQLYRGGWCTYPWLPVFSHTSTTTTFHPSHQLLIPLRRSTYHSPIGGRQLKHFTMAFVKCRMKVLLDRLEALGHNITMEESAGSVIQGIKVQNGVITANSDYRKYGAPDGY